MPASSDSALALAGHLRALPDATLAELIGAREIREQGIRDFFDLAEAMLAPDAVQRALSRFDRPTLVSLAALASGPATTTDVAARREALGAPPAAPGPHLELAARLALALEHDGTFELLRPVAEQFETWPSLGLPARDELAQSSPPAALAPVSQTDSRFTDHVAAENAFATTTAILELLAALQHESARELARGGVALPDSKRLAAAMGVELERVPGLLEIASRAGLAALDAARWMPTGASSDWVVSSSGQRWASLAGAWLSRLPGDIRDILSTRAHATWGDGLDEYIAWYYPAGGEWMHDRVRVYTRDAELLGITADHVPSTPGITLLTDGEAAAAPVMAELFPPEVSQVYLQHDLSIVSPGPLRPDLDARLRTIADVEGRALASTYRVSTSSIYRAMAAGETASSIREFLSSISLTGIPQPLAYLLAEASERYGLVRVGSTRDGHTYVRTSDATLLRSLLVDHAVAALSLGRMGDHLETRFDRDVVFFTLSEARYPVAAEDPDGTIVTLTRRRPASAAPVAAPSAGVALVQKLRLVGSDDPVLSGREWLSRQIDVAIKAKAALTVTVQMPDGSAVEYQLEPASIAGGRLRARDRRADIERTLPLASITEVGPPF